MLACDQPDLQQSGSLFAAQHPPMNPSCLARAYKRPPNAGDYEQPPTRSLITLCC